MSMRIVKSGFLVKSMCIDEVNWITAQLLHPHIAGSMPFRFFILLGHPVFLNKSV